MQLTLSEGDLASYLEKQLTGLFPDGVAISLGPVVTTALKVLEARFRRIRLGTYSNQTSAKFNHLNSDQYASFIYECSRIAARNYNDTQLAEKLFCLNKALNAIVCMYDTDLPATFILIHTVGTVLGKAKYGNDLVVCHGVTVGADRGNVPTLDDGVVLFGGSSVLGASHLGRNVTVAAGTVILNRDIPPDHVVAGSGPGLIVKPARRNLREYYFRLEG